MSAVDAIRCEGLSKSYGKVAALDGLSLTLEEGLVCGFLGPNGAGKTTTVKLLTGLSQPTRGRAWVAGEAVNPNSISFRSRIGYLPEEPAFYNWMTAREFLCHIAGLFGLGGKAAGLRAEELLETAGLREASRRRIGGFSRGMRQRLGLAQSLVNRPRVLFLDEPTTGFDPEARRDFWELIEGLKSEGTTILLTTHYLEEAEHLADRVAVISRGQVLACDTPARLGGRERGGARVSWLENGVVVESQTLEPTRTVLDLAARLGGEVPGLSVQRERLEDVYLSLLDDDRYAQGGDSE